MFYDRQDIERTKEMPKPAWPSREWGAEDLNTLDTYTGMSKCGGRRKTRKKKIKRKRTSKTLQRIE